MDGLLHNNNKGKRRALEFDTFHSSTKKKKGRWVLQYVEEEDETTITSQKYNGLLQRSMSSTHHYPNAANNNNHLLTSHQYQLPLPSPSYWPPHIMATAKQMDKERKMKKRIDMMEMELNKLKSSHHNNNSNTQDCDNSLP